MCLTLEENGNLDALFLCRWEIKVKHERKDHENST